jgi:hypothetical protein
MTKGISFFWQTKRTTGPSAINPTLETIGGFSYLATSTRGILECHSISAFSSLSRSSDCSSRQMILTAEFGKKPFSPSHETIHKTVTETTALFELLTGKQKEMTVRC